MLALPTELWRNTYPPQLSRLPTRAMEDRIYVRNTAAPYQLINAMNLLHKFQDTSQYISWDLPHHRKTGCAELSKNEREVRTSGLTSVVSCWRIPIFPGRRQPSIVGTTELNFCVRNGNRWTLCVNLTNSGFHVTGIFPARLVPRVCTFRDSNPGPTD